MAGQPGIFRGAPGIFPDVPGPANSSPGIFHCPPRLRRMAREAFFLAHSFRRTARRAFFLARRRRWEARKPFHRTRRARRIVRVSGETRRRRSRSSCVPSRPQQPAQSLPPTRRVALAFFRTLGVQKTRKHRDFFQALTSSKSENGAPFFVLSRYFLGSDLAQATSGASGVLSITIATAANRCRPDEE